MKVVIDDSIKDYNYEIKVSHAMAVELWAMASAAAFHCENESRRHHIDSLLRGHEENNAKVYRAICKDIEGQQ